MTEIYFYLDGKLHLFSLGGFCKLLQTFLQRDILDKYLKFIYKSNTYYGREIVDNDHLCPIIVITFNV